MFLSSDCLTQRFERSGHCQLGTFCEGRPSQFAAILACLCYLAASDWEVRSNTDSAVAILHWNNFMPKPPDIKFFSIFLKENLRNSAEIRLLQATKFRISKNLQVAVFLLGHLIRISCKVPPPDVLAKAEPKYHTHNMHQTFIWPNYNSSPT